jgi:hypothetical protein
MFKGKGPKVWRRMDPIRSFLVLEIVHIYFEVNNMTIRKK